MLSDDSVPTPDTSDDTLPSADSVKRYLKTKPHKIIKVLKEYEEQIELLDELIEKNPREVGLVESREQIYFEWVKLKGYMQETKDFGRTLLSNSSELGMDREDAQTLIKRIRPTLGESQGQIVVPIIERDEIVDMESIGKGAYGDVFKAKCRHETVAVKQLTRIDTSSKLIKKFLLEVAIMAHLNHKNILRLIGVCKSGDNISQWLIVSEYMPLGSLDKVLFRGSKLTLKQKIDFCFDISSGLNWLHESSPQIIHHDLKPANILVDSNYTLKIADFGLSAINRKREKFCEETLRGSMLYSSPEVLEGAEIDSSIDVYSFALIMWEIFTQTEVFKEYSDQKIFKNAICKQSVRPPDHKKIPLPIANIMKACWAHNPKIRPTFKKLKGTLIPEAQVDCYLKSFDTKASKFWKRYWNHQYHVKWIDFLDKLISECAWEGKNNKKLQAALKQSLEVLMGGEKENICLEDFQKFLRWFGPLNAKKSKENILSIMQFTMTQSWFYGDIAAVEAETKLKGQSAGSFLVRVCTHSKVKKHPWTILRIDQKKNVIHTRVSLLKNQENGQLGTGLGVVLSREGHEDEKYLAPKTSRIVDFILELQKFKPKFIAQPCDHKVGGNKFQRIWEGISVGKYSVLVQQYF